MLFVYSYKNDFFLSFFYFLSIMIYILNIAKAIKKMTVKELKNFTFKNYHQQMRFAKGNNHYLTKH